jgi:hypothetical protein
VLPELPRPTGFNWKDTCAILEKITGMVLVIKMQMEFDLLLHKCDGCWLLSHPIYGIGVPFTDWKAPDGIEFACKA